MNAVDLQFVLVVLSVVGAGGIAWGAARAGASETRRALGELKELFQEHVAEDHKTQLANVRQLAELRLLITEVHRVVVKR